MSGYVLKRENEIFMMIGGYTRNRILQKAIISFLQMRREVFNVPITTETLNLLFDKLNGFASDDESKIYILNQSIDKKWKWVYPIKENNKNNYNKRFSMGFGYTTSYDLDEMEHFCILDDISDDEDKMLALATGIRKPQKANKASKDIA